MALGSNMKKASDITQKKSDGKKAIKKRLIAKSKRQEPKKKEPRKSSKSVQGAAVESFISTQQDLKRKEARIRYNADLESMRGQDHHFLVFDIGASKYAIEIDKVREVMKFDGLSATPQTPDHLPGIVHYRGRSFVGLDLARKFTMEVSEHHYSIVLRHVNRVALLLNNIPTSLKISGEEIEPLSELVIDVSLDEVYVKGVFRLITDAVYLLDLGELIRSDRTIVVPDELVNVE